MTASEAREIFQRQVQALRPSRWLPRDADLSRFAIGRALLLGAPGRAITLGQACRLPSVTG